MGALVQLLPHHHRLRPAKGGSAPSSPCPWLPDRPSFRRITSLRLRSGPQSCSPLDQAHPLRGGRDFYARAFPTAGHPTAKSGITTQLSGPLLRRDLHPLGQCCYGLQLRSGRVMLSLPSSPLRPDVPVSSTPADFTGSPLIPQVFAWAGAPTRPARPSLLWLPVSLRLPPCSHAGRPLACSRPVPSASASAITQSSQALGISIPTVSLEHPYGLLVGRCFDAISSPMATALEVARPPLSDRPRCTSASGRRDFYPSLPSSWSPSPRVGHCYGADLGNCAGGSFPR